LEKRIEALVEEKAQLCLHNKRMMQVLEVTCNSKELLIQENCDLRAETIKLRGELAKRPPEMWMSKEESKNSSAGLIALRQIWDPNADKGYHTKDKRF
jgi:regulator of replication initiation timing